MSLKYVFLWMVFWSITSAHPCDEITDCRACVKTKPCVFYLNEFFNFCSLPDIHAGLYDFKIRSTSACLPIDDAQPSGITTKQPSGITTKQPSAVLNAIDRENKDKTSVQSPPVTEIYAALEAAPLPSDRTTRKKKTKSSFQKLVESVCAQFDAVYAVVHPNRSSQYERCLRKIRI